LDFLRPFPGHRRPLTLERSGCTVYAIGIGSAKGRQRLAADSRRSKGEEEKRMGRSVLMMLALALAALAASPALGAGGLSPGVYVLALNGTWRLAFVGRHFSIKRNGKAAVAGLTTISAKRVTFRDMSGPYRCTGSQAVGTYRWSRSGKSLTLTVVRDACSGRKAILTNGFTTL
jgi:hypothetical protein